GDRTFDGAGMDRALIYTGRRGDCHSGGDPARSGILSIVRRVADRRDRLAAGSGRHAHADAMPFDRLLGYRTAARSGIVFPARVGRAGFMDRTLSRADCDRLSIDGFLVANGVGLVARMAVEKRRVIK